MFIPVIFVCFVDGQCSFFQDAPVYKIQECVAKIRKLEQASEASDKVKAYKTTCIVASKEAGL